ncbi:hypothetical protein [Mannheimia haemolytica]|uniref:hypothetical protein n=1 Tax=Mannheimia haemolytica TaxID=75985 RepID=UPI0001BCF832|nr:hypothetical protein [Mannheimia haemolytica]EEY12064.1 hypothetical protein COK_1887 [Mannheimia haemolytica serotype A2 str. BOVINE]MDW0723741.1 hypothetical protein [Mannheimia haemolytica]MDW0736806.1 hypothetical protein [Mannheimia haemolytica]HDL3366615.1 hypothetical protein [Mannheimia haemolytica]
MAIYEVQLITTLHLKVEAKSETLAESCARGRVDAAFEEFEIYYDGMALQEIKKED